MSGRGRLPAVTAVVLVLAALAVGRVVTDRLPDPSVAAVPHEVPVTIQHPTRLRTLDLTVLGVVGSRHIVVAGERRTSPGVWVVAAYEVVPRTEPDTLAYAAVRDSSGRVWQGGRDGSRCQQGRPGMRTQCLVWIEMDPAALPGARLLLARSAESQDYDELAVVDLGVSAAQAGTWRATTTPLDTGAPLEGTR